jgi:hypothetical protein
MPESIDVKIEQRKILNEKLQNFHFRLSTSLSYKVVLLKLFTAAVDQVVRGG